VLGVVSLVVAYSAGRHEVLVIAGFCLLLVIVGAIVVRIRKPRFELIRLFAPPVVSAGGVTRVTVRVRNIASRASTQPARRSASLPNTSARPMRRTRSSPRLSPKP